VREGEFVLACGVLLYFFWKVLDIFSKISSTWKVLENEFGPGKF